MVTSEHCNYLVMLIFLNPWDDYRKNKLGFFRVVMVGNNREGWKMGGERREVWY